MCDYCSVFYLVFSLKPGAVPLFSATGDIPSGTGPIWLNVVQCTGEETRLIDCPAIPSAVSFCSHIHDTGVECRGMHGYI